MYGVKADPMAGTSPGPDVHHAECLDRGLPCWRKVPGSMGIHCIVQVTTTLLQPLVLMLL